MNLRTLATAPAAEGRPDARFRFEETTEHKLFQPLVRCTVHVGIKVFLLSLRDALQEVLQQDIQVLDHATHVAGVELQRLL